MSDVTAVQLTEKINLARRRVLEGEQLSIEEQAELVKLLRQNRMAASETSSKSKSKKVAAKGMDDDALQDSLNAAFGGGT